MSESDPLAHRSQRLIACAIIACGAALMMGLGSIANALQLGTGNDVHGTGVFVLLIIGILFLIDWVGSWRESNRSKIVEKYKQELKGN